MPQRETKEPIIYGIMDAKTGEYKRLVQAQGVKELRAHLLRDVTFDVPSSATVSRLKDAKMVTEKAGE